MKYVITFLILFSITCAVTVAQTTDASVLVRNAGVIANKQTVLVKWYSKGLYYEGGVNIYRQEGQGIWQKLNVSPIRRLDTLSRKQYAEDEDLEFFVPYIKGSKKSDINGLFLVNVLVKSFESEVFSQFLGIFYKDTTVTVGKTYAYKIMKLKGNTEFLLAQSKSIVVGPEIVDEPLQDISYKADTNKVFIKWRPEEKRFFATNVYRGNDNKVLNLINESPVMISMVADSLGRLQYPKIFYLDDTVRSGIYYYQISGLDFFGKETKRSEVIQVEVKDLIPPPAPEGLEDSIRNLDVVLNWKNNPVPDLIGMNVYRSIKSSGPFIRLNATTLDATTTSYKDVVPHAGPYYYYITAVDQARNENKSYTIFSEVHDIVPPSIPLELIAVSDTGIIKLTWKRNLEDDLKGYMIYRAVTKNDKNNFVLLNATPVEEPFYEDRLPKNARNLFVYKILAIDTSYNKSNYSEVTGIKMPDVIPPVKPLIIHVTNIQNNIRLEWLSNKDEDLKGYDLYRSKGTEDFIRINKETIPSAVQFYEDTDISSATLYCYYLKALDSTGNASLASNIEKGYNNFTTLTIPILKVKYNKNKKAVQLSWNKDAAAGNLIYVVYRSETEGKLMKPISSRLEAEIYQDNEVISGITYMYELRVYDTNGNISRSESIKITIK